MRGSRSVAIITVSVAIGTFGCSSPTEIDDDAPIGAEATDGDKYDRAGVSLPSFAEVDGSHSSATFRRYVGRALALLRDHDTEIGQLTYRSIVDQKIRIDELVDLTCRDYRRYLAETPDSGLTEADWATLQKTNGRAGKLLTEQLNGYMWSDRIYVARGLPVEKLAATLVHETNHVLNHSEAGYYDDLPSSGFREEYRAFYAEREFDPAAWKNIELKTYVADLYDFTPSQIHKSLWKEPLTPRLLPDEEGWLDRDLAADPSEGKGCPRD